MINELNFLLTDLHLALSEVAKQKILAYIQLIHKWNQHFNLTAIKTPEEMLIEHIADSLTITPFISGKEILDIGSGAGLPGIPLAVVFPEFHFTLLDSVGKKTRFLNQVVAELKLSNVTVVQSRVEAFFPKHCFNTILARAFGTIGDIMSKAKHLVCAQGQLLLMKGVYPTEELKGITASVKVHALTVPKLNKQRHVVCIQL